MIQEIGKNHYKLIVNVSKDGKRIARKTKTVHCGKREANRLYAEFEREVKLSASMTNDSLSEMISSYIASCEVRGLSETTIHKYKGIQKRIFSFLTDESVIKVNSVDINIFVSQMANKGYSAKTIKNTISLLSSAFARYVSLGMLNDNPCSNVQLPKLVKNEPNIITKLDLIEFQKVLNDVDLDTRVGLELALYKGLRRSEILGLKESDYDPVNHCISINRSRHLINGEIIVKSPKNESSKRVLSLPKSLEDDIRTLIELHNSYDFEIDDWLILKGNKAMRPSYLSNVLARKTRKFGMECVSIHALRHSFATMLLNSNAVDIAQISKELGHSQISTTLNIYSHATGGASVSSKQISNITNNLMNTSI